MLVMYSVSPPITNEALNRLFSESWDDHQAGNFAPVLARSLAYVCAYHERRLVGFVNVAWDGGNHAFLLDTTVHPSVRRQRDRARTGASGSRSGTGARDRLAARRLRAALRRLRSCGFRETEAG